MTVRKDSSFLCNPLPHRKLIAVKSYYNRSKLSILSFVFENFSHTIMALQLFIKMAFSLD